MAHQPTDFTTVVDDFNRADDATHPPGGDWSTGHVWSGQPGLQILSQQLAIIGPSYSDGYLTTTHTAPMAVGFTVAATGVSQNFLHAVQDPQGTAGNGGGPNNYELVLQDTQIDVQRRADGATADTVGGTLGASLAVGDKAMLIVDDDGNVYGWHKTAAGAWTLYATLAQAVLTGPFHPGFESNGTAERLDDMIAGAPVAAGGGLAVAGFAFSTDLIEAGADV